MTLVNGSFDCSVTLSSYEYSWPNINESKQAKVKLYGREYAGIVVEVHKPIRSRPFAVQMSRLAYTELFEYGITK